MKWFWKKTPRCRYYEWDEDDFRLPQEYQLHEKSDLADALNVFYAAGGTDFFQVEDPEQYASAWQDFLGNLYVQIEKGEFVPSGKTYTVPLSEKQRRNLRERGVPDVFLTDL